MARQFHRACSLSLGSGGKTGYVARYGQDGKDEGLKIDFEVESHTVQTPDQCGIIVYNLPQATAQKVSKEFTEIVLNCGYDGNEAELFRGTIVESQYGEKVDGFTSTILRISAANSDLAYNNAQVNTTLPAGSTHKDIVDRCADALKPYGVSMGQIVGVDLGQIKFPRAITLSGMVRDVLRRTCLANGANFTFSGSQLNILHRTASGLGSSGIVLSDQTGLVGQVIQRPEGVIARCLINPAIKVNTTVKIASKIISPTVTPNAILPGSTDKQTQLQNQLNAAGEYRVLHYVAQGSTRGEDWTMTLTTLGVGRGLNTIQANLGYDPGTPTVGLSQN